MPYFLFHEVSNSHGIKNLISNPIFVIELEMKMKNFYGINY
jgi:hypothetical protein